MVTKFINARIITLDENFTCIENGTLTVDGGNIAEIGGSSDLSKGEKTVDLKGDILMPGLINCHAHLGMSLFRGVSENRNLDSWLSDVIFPMEKKLTPEDVYYGTMLSVAECARGGITYIADSYYFNESASQAASVSGMGMAILGADMDINKPYTRVIESIQADFQKYSGGNVKYIPGCHSVYTCSEKLLEAVADFCSANKAFPYIHLSETLKEVGDCTQQHAGLTPPEYLHKLGYFDYGGLVAHGVHMDKDDIALLKQSGVSVAHCPGSNLKLGSGIAPVYSMLDKGLNVCLGTDSNASNNALDIFREMFLASMLQKGVMNISSAVSPQSALKMATVNGARALGLTDRGMLKKGMRADIIRIDVNSPHFQPQTDFVSALVYSAKSSDVKMTMSGGKVLYEDGQYNIGEDLGRIYAECNSRLKRLI